MESNYTTRASSGRLRLRDGILQHYPDVLAPEAIDALEALAGFDGSDIPHDLQCQWIQGTGPATRPRSTVDAGIRNIAYALKEPFLRIAEAVSAEMNDWAKGFFGRRIIED